MYSYLSSRPVPFSQPVLFFHCTEPFGSLLRHLLSPGGRNEAGPQAAAQRSVSEGMGSQFSVRPGMKWDYMCGRGCHKSAYSRSKCVIAQFAVQSSSVCASLSSSPVAAK